MSESAVLPPPADAPAENAPASDIPAASPPPADASAEDAPAEDVPASDTPAAPAVSTSPTPSGSGSSKYNDSSITTLSGSTGISNIAPDRAARWKALQSRAKSSLATNRAEVYAERRRQQHDPSQTAKLERKKAEAEFKLAKAEAHEAGEDFERKRAWDWTVDEAARWDRRVAKKSRHAADVAFQDFSQNARKVYKRQLRDLKPDLDAYGKARDAAIVKDGGGVVETEDGELVAVDVSGDFYAGVNSLGFVENKPPKEAVDRLVNDMRKAEDKRMQRRKGGDEEDVTYINDKNKSFNQKLARWVAFFLYPSLFVLP